MGSSPSKEKKEYKRPEPKSVQYPKLVAGLPDQANKVVVITGCTTGTGFHAARAAAKKNAHVVMLNRPSERAEKAKQAILEEYPNATVTFIPCDLSKFDSVRSAAEELKQKFPDGIDVCCNNAGIMAMPNGAGPDGYEVQMTTNHLSHFLLNKEIFSLLEKAAQAKGEARIVNHSSGARKDPNTPFDAKYYGKDMSVLGDDSPEFPKGGRWHRYHQTKLANCIYTYALKAKLQSKGSNVKALVATPGFAATNLQTTTDQNGGLPGLIHTLAPYLAQSAEDGACGILECMFNPTAQSGDFFRPAAMLHEVYGKAVKCKPEKLLTDPKACEGLWKCSEEACGQWSL